MIVYVAIDDNKGLMFNGRRQSQDKSLRENVLQDCCYKKLWMNEYTKTQFSSCENENIMVDNDFLEKAGEEESCFVENNLLSSYEEKISKIVIYKWNRDYPADFYFDIDLSGWQLASSEEFVGSSHERITKEVWVR